MGAGAWGTALAQIQAKAGRKVTLWAREKNACDDMHLNRENRNYLPGIRLDKNITITNTVSDLHGCDILLVVTPAQYIRSSFELLFHENLKDKPIVVCSKGIEIETGLMLSEILEEVIPHAIPLILTGPCFAREVAMELPTGVTIACKNEVVARDVSLHLGCKTLRPYITTDIIGAQIAGAVKNVLAIGCGIVHGLNLGENARAALITRGVAEMARLGDILGAEEKTLMGMCGLGDIILTCTSTQSRNFSLGSELGQGRKLDDILNERQTVTEGVTTAKALNILASNNGLEMPITQIIYQCLFEGLTPKNAVEKLLNRPFDL